MKKISPFYPFLFSCYPLLHLYSFNIATNYIGSGKDIFLLGSLTLFFSLIGFLVLLIIFRHCQKAAFALFIFLLLFFSYSYLTKIININLSFIFHREIFLGLTIIFISFCIFLSSQKSSLISLTNFFNLCISFLILIPLIKVLVSHYQLRIITPKLENSYSKVKEVNLKPDIYFIVLDAYASQDILQDYYQYDNNDFLRFLTNKGFYIANQSQSNYGQTYLSIASTLNMTYLNDLTIQNSKFKNERLSLGKLISNNKVVNLLRNDGYKFVFFSSGVTTLDFINPDIYIKPSFVLSELDQTYLNLTPIPVICNLLGLVNQYDLHRKRILYLLDHLNDIAKIDSPTFTYVHILIPHPPFVFQENSESIIQDKYFTFADGELFFERKSYLKGYTEQLSFLNIKVKETIDKIITNSDNPPIIILQADHGPASNLNWDKPDKKSLKERLSILNAYYFPDRNYHSLYKNISPVNSFRLILNQYFGYNLPLLEDKSYFSTWKEPYKFIPIK